MSDDFSLDFSSSDSMSLGLNHMSKMYSSESVTERPPVEILSHTSMKHLASAITSRCHTLMRSVTGNLPSSARRVEISDRIVWNKFDDEFPNIFIKDVKQVERKDLIFIASFHSPEIIFEQLSVLFALPRYLARSVVVILPYFPTGTMERVDTEGQIATAKTLTTLLSSIPSTARGPTQIMIFDIHALQERFYFSDTVIPRLETAIPLLLRELGHLKSPGIAIVFPDEGAFKRFHLSFKDKPVIVCYKIREGTSRKVRIKEGKPSGYHCIIVDDLVQTGGTLIECAKAIKAEGAVKVSAYVTHPVFPKESWKKFTESSSHFENFWITDSIPHAVEICRHPPFKLLSLSDVIANVLLGYDLLIN